MKIKPECYLCLYTQTFKLVNKLNLSPDLQAEILQEVGVILSKYHLNVTPPHIASEIYQLISSKTSIQDPFKTEKELSIKKALEIKKQIKPKTLFEAVKLAISGNVIDLGVNDTLDIETELQREISFKINHFDKFEQEVLKAKNICYLADNAGENVFDEILIEFIKNLNPSVEIFYVVRGKPIINDVTFNDVKKLDISKLAQVIDSKVNTPGFDLTRASKEAKEIFYNADVVISKGMGNFEVLYNECNKEVFYLFKVKCNVVASEIDANKGDYILVKGLK